MSIRNKYSLAIVREGTIIACMECEKPHKVYLDIKNIYMLRMEGTHFQLSLILLWLTRQFLTSDGTDIDVSSMFYAGKADMLRLRPYSKAAYIFERFFNRFNDFIAEPGIDPEVILKEVCDLSQNRLSASAFLNKYPFFRVTDIVDATV